MQVTPAEQLAAVRAAFPDVDAAAFLASSDAERGEQLAAYVDAAKVPHDVLADAVRVLQIAGVLIGAIAGAVTPGAALVNLVIAAVKAGAAAK